MHKLPALSYLIAFYGFPRLLLFQLFSALRLLGKITLLGLLDQVVVSTEAAGRVAKL